MFVKKTIDFRSTVWLVFLVCSLSGQSDFSFNNISVKDGLAESTVKVIYEDHEGFIYFGTENGLDIYNGYEFKNYIMNSFDDASILGNKVSCIYEDSNNMIWVGTELGVSRFDPLSRTFSRPVKLDIKSQAVFTDPETMAEDEKGNIWIKLLDSGLIFRYNLNEQTTDCLNCNTGSSLDGEKVNVLYKDQNNIVWLGTDSGLFYFNIESGTITEFDLPNGSNTTSVNDIKQGGASDLWVGTTVGLFRIKNGIKGTIDVFKKEKDTFSIVSNFVKDLDWNGEKNELWIATNDGLSRYVPKEDQFYNIQTTPFADSIIENDISEILIAVESGRLWFTTENHSGLNCLSVVLDPYEGDLDTVFNELKLTPFCPVPIQICPALSSIKSVILLSAIEFGSTGSCSK
jgi:ligand-binding sensor domain-containing protein